MMKLTFIAVLLLEAAIIWFSGFFAQVVVPQKQTGAIPEAYYITVIGVLAAGISGMFVYIKALNKDHAKQLESLYNKQLLEYKEVVMKNTEGFHVSASASEKVADATDRAAIVMEKQTAMLTAMQIWLSDRLRKD